MIDKKIKSIEEIAYEKWQSARNVWGNPNIPTVVNAAQDSDFEQLGAVGQSLRGELAFMQYPAFQTYANMVRIREELCDVERGYGVVVKHELGHRFCPYDSVTALFLSRKAEQGLVEGRVQGNPKVLAPKVLNLFTDTCINTKLARDGEGDIVWVYQKLCGNAERVSSPVWRVYVQSCERVWNARILPVEVVLSDDERVASEQIAGLFVNRNTLERAWWEGAIKDYARVLAPFMTEENSKNSCVVDCSGEHSIPSSEQAKELLGEIARRLARQGSDGLPTNPDAIREYRDVVAGWGEGDIVKASVSFYEQLALKYCVRFASQPYGRQRSSPFSLRKWCPSDPVGELDVQHSVLTSGVVVPGVTTQKWRSRTSTVKSGERECIPTLDILIDSSGSMPNPVEVVSLPVLAGFVAARRAQRQGVRVLNYDGKCVEIPRTHDLGEVYKGLVMYQNGGTVFPVEQFLACPEEDPRLSLIITDTFFANTDQAVRAMSDFRKRNKHNRVTIYAITSLPNVDELIRAGAECIHGTTPNIFKHVLGKTERAYVTA